MGGCTSQPAPGCCTNAESEERRAWSRLDNFHKAAEQGRLSDILRILDAGREVVLQQDSKGWTGLHFAAVGGHERVVDYLIEVGGHHLIQRPDVEGKTALHRAAFAGWIRVVAILVDIGGADLLLTKDDHGWTALHFAVYSSTLQRSEGQSFDAPSEQKLEVVEYLVAQGGNELLLARAEQGQTALHMVAACGQIEVCQKLVEAGGSKLLVATDEQGCTPMHVASRRGHHETACFLGEAGGDSGKPPPFVPGTKSVEEDSEAGLSSATGSFPDQVSEASSKRRQRPGRSKKEAPPAHTEQKAGDKSGRRADKMQRRGCMSGCMSGVCPQRPASSPPPARSVEWTGQGIVGKPTRNVCGDGKLKEPRLARPVGGLADDSAAERRHKERAEQKTRLVARRAGQEDATPREEAVGNACSADSNPFQDPDVVVDDV